MQKLIEQINEQIALFTENAKAQVEKITKPQVPAHARPLWS